MCSKTVQWQEISIALGFDHVTYLPNAVTEGHHPTVHDKGLVR